MVRQSGKGQLSIRASEIDTQPPGEHVRSPGRPFHPVTPSSWKWQKAPQKETLSSAWQKVANADEHGTYAEMLRHESRRRRTFEEWQRIEGEWFARPRWLSIFHFLVLPMFLALFPIGVISLGVSVVFFSRNNIGGGVECSGLLFASFSYPPLCVGRHGILGNPDSLHSRSLQVKASTCLSNDPSMSLGMKCKLWVRST